MATTATTAPSAANEVADRGITAVAKLAGHDDLEPSERFAWSMLIECDGRVGCDSNRGNPQ
jgi:hypothetical protein